MEYESFLKFVAFILAFCTFCDLVATPEENQKNKEILERWYYNLWNFKYSDAVKAINDHFLKVFDSIYSVNHFSFKCISISFLTSITVVSITLLLLGSDSLFAITEMDDEDRFMIINAIILVYLANCIIDYFSLLQTRLFFRISFNRHPRVLPFFLIADIVCSAVIFILSFEGIILLVDFISEYVAEDNYFMTLVEYIYLSIIYPTVSIILERDTDTNPSELGIINYFYVMFFSTFATSLLYYLFLISHLLIRSLSGAQTRLIQIILTVQRSDHTYKAVGAVIAVIVGLFKATASWLAVI